MRDGYTFFGENWRNRIINSYYIMVGLIFAAEIVTLIMLKTMGIGVKIGTFGYCVIYVVLPSSLNLGSVAFAEYYVKGHSPERKKNLVLLGCLFAVCMITATFHGAFLITSGIFVMPIVVSVMFDDLKLTRFTSVIAVLLMGVSILLASVFDHTWNLEERAVNGLAGIVFIVVVHLISEALIHLSQEKNAIIVDSNQVNSEMSNALKRDPMTGLYNHSEFYRKLEEEKDVCQKKHQNMTIVVVDVDFFKKVNDNYGHENGDVVLIRISSILKEVCGTLGTICRYGGEEFALIFENRNAAYVYGIMEQVRKAVNSSKFDFMPGKQVGVSCGIYEYRGEDMEAEEIFNKADQAMYHAKKTGRNQCVCYRNIEVQKPDVCCGEIDGKKLVQSRGN